MNRRSFLKIGIAGVAGVGLLHGNELSATTPELGPYSSIEGNKPDKNGFLLPDGYESKVVAIGGELVEGTDYQWHLFSSGAGTISDGNNGWFFISNSEVSNFLTPDETWGGASSIHFDASGSIIDAQPILAWSHSNGGGAVTPWGTWLSCESDLSNAGKVWECDPTGKEFPVLLNGIGLRNHSGVAVDPERECLYLTENHRKGLFYRYKPSKWPDLKAGVLEALVIETDGSISWSQVEDPQASFLPVREQVKDGWITPGASGCWYEKDSIYFSTRFDDSIHVLDLAKNQYELIWDGEKQKQPLSGVGDLTVDPLTGDIFIAEASGNMEVVVIGPGGTVSPFCRMVDPEHDFSSLKGLCFDPNRTRLYVSSQRGPGNRLVRDVIPAINWGKGSYGRRTGVTYEITGPFRTAEKPDTLEAQSTIPILTTTTLAGETLQFEDLSKRASPPTIQSDQKSTTTILKQSLVQPNFEVPIKKESSSNSGMIVGFASMFVAIIGAGVVALRQRSSISDTGKKQIK